MTLDILMTDIVILENPISTWLVAFGITTVNLVLAALLRRVLRRRLSHAPSTEGDVDDFLLDELQRTRLWLLLFPLLYLSLRGAHLPPEAGTILRIAAFLSLLGQAGLWLAGFVDYWLARQRRIRAATDPAAATTIAAFGFALKLFLWSLVLLLAIDNLGFDVTALITGLGIGGVAVALATQNILGDLFASLSIVLDKPFVVGDVIHVGDFIGTVEHIGLKTTRLRSLSGEQVVFSNTDLIQSRIRNYKRMSERRVVFTFGVVYETPAEKLEQIPRLVREMIERQSGTRFERAHFRAFGESAFDFEVVYWILDPDYNLYMDRQQSINFSLLQAFQSEQIQFAYPTRTLLVRQTGNPS